MRSVKTLHINLEVLVGKLSLKDDSFTATPFAEIVGDAPGGER